MTEVPASRFAPSTPTQPESSCGHLLSADNPLPYEQIPPALETKRETWCSQRNYIDPTFYNLGEESVHNILCKESLLDIVRKIEA